MSPISVWSIPHKAEKVHLHIDSPETPFTLLMRVAVRSKLGTYLSRTFEVDAVAGAPPKVVDLKINLKEIAAYRIEPVACEWPSGVRVVLV